MSLIQDALKRQQEEMQKTPAGAAPETPPATPHAPVPAGPGQEPPNGEPAPEKPGRNWLMLVGILLGVVALCGLGGWLSFMALQKWAAPLQPGIARETPPVPLLSSAGTTAVQAASGTGAVASISHEPDILRLTNAALADATGTTVIAATTTNAPPAPAVLPSTNVAATSSGAAATTTPVAVSPPPEVRPVALATPVVTNTPAPPPKPVVWPSLKITGVLERGERGAALINGRVIAVGEEIQGVKVIAVGKNGVTLEYEGARKTVRTGEQSE